MKINIYFSSVIIAVITLVSCDRSESRPPESMVFDEVEYIEEFPLTFSLQNGTEPALATIGARNFAIYDSLMIISTANGGGLWSFLSLPEYNSLGSFLNSGKGPFEFVYPPSVADKTKLTTEDDQVQAYIYDFQGGRVLKMNVGESIRTNELQISRFRDSLPSFLFNFVLIDSLTSFSKKASPTHNQQNRYLVSNHEKSVPPIMERLNKASVAEGEDINILSTMTKASPDGNLLVEMPIGLNFINLYSPDGSIAKTLCIGSEIYGIDEVQLEGRWDRLYTFSDLRIFNDFFGVVHINEAEGTYQTKREKLPSILFFTWSGEPLAELKLDSFITSFDIDFINGTLYTFDVHLEEFQKYDIRDILLEMDE